MTVGHDRRGLSPEADAAVSAALVPGETIRIVVRGTLGSALLATDRRVLIWKNRQLREFRWENVSELAFGGGPVVRWLQVRGPSNGLVRPSLLNVGVLADTIQVGEMVSDDARAVLKALVRVRARGKPREIEESAAAVATDSDEVVMEAVGAGGRLLLLRDRVRILHAGFRGLFRESLPAEQEVRLADVAVVDWHPPGPLRVGRIGFRTGPTGSAVAVSPENEVMFYLQQEPAFREIKAELDRRLALPHTSIRGAARRTRPR